MGNLLLFLELAAISLWLGSIVFFSFVVAPALFRSLGKETAGMAVRTIFPQYYLLGIACGLVLCGVQVARGLLWYWGGMIRPSIVLFVLLTAVAVYARQRLTPAVDAARKEGESGKTDFDRLHRRSVQLNAFLLLCLVVHIIWMAMRGY
ncbi:MAG: DUF4149 domain-containing protein [Acidobacteria bacterium]|nr:DUF4149 domain-containing protein [Acidobacteriota bacterium]